jgi:hypothetical protein
MSLSYSDKRKVFEALQQEVKAASKALQKARMTADSADYEYGGSIECELAAAVLEVKKAQYEAAVAAADRYYYNHIAVI